MGRRAFLRRMLVGTAFATPVVASFAMTGVAAANPTHGPHGPGSPLCNSNATVISGSNATVISSPNATVIGNQNQHCHDPFCDDFFAFERSLVDNGRR